MGRNGHGAGRTDRQWKALIERYERGSVTQACFCAREGVAMSSSRPLAAASARQAARRRRGERRLIAVQVREEPPRAADTACAWSCPRGGHRRAPADPAPRGRGPGSARVIAQHTKVYWRACHDPRANPSTGWPARSTLRRPTPSPVISSSSAIAAKTSARSSTGSATASGCGTVPGARTLSAGRAFCRTGERGHSPQQLRWLLDGFQLESVQGHRRAALSIV